MLLKKNTPYIASE